MRKRDFVSYTSFAFSEGEVARLLSACGTLADYIMILLAVRYGFRREDIVRLRIRDINIEQKTLTFYEKKKDRTRTIPIEYDVSMELKRYIATLPKNEIFLLPFQDGIFFWIRILTTRTLITPFLNSCLPAQTVPDAWNLCANTKIGRNR